MIRRRAAEALDWGRAGLDWAAAIASKLRRRLARDGGSPSCDIPVIILPGVLEPWRYLLPLGTWFEEQAHPVHYVTKLGLNLRGYEDSARHVAELAAEHLITGAVIVAHSKGGLIGKAAMLADETGAIAGMVSVATPFRGSGLARRLQRFGWAKRTPFANLFEGAPELAGLRGEHEVNARIVSMAPRWDQVVAAESTRLPGATHVDLERGGHFAPMRDKAVWTLIHEQVHMLAGRH